MSEECYWQIGTACLLMIGGAALALLALGVVL